MLIWLKTDKTKTLNEKVKLSELHEINKKQINH